MHNCTGEMFEWWFRSRLGNREYIWWHPVDHISSHWAEGEEGTHLGSIHLAKKYFTGLPLAELAIQFRDATKFFTVDKYNYVYSLSKIFVFNHLKVFSFMRRINSISSLRPQNKKVNLYTHLFYV